MTKPWEETWTFGFGDEPDVCLSGEFIGTFASHREDDNDDDMKRARLAACAPEMARMLLAREWEDDFVCASCRRTNYDGNAAHTDDCEWLLLMQKVGVR